MRCPRCGYLSFDHLESCRKCHKPLAQGEQVGTTYLAAVPSFLNISVQRSRSSFDAEAMDTLDPDLDLLVDDGEDLSAGRSEHAMPQDEGFEIDFEAGGQEGQGLDNDDIVFDTSRFETVPVNMDAVQATSPAQIAIPEELADISDLAPPLSMATENAASMRGGLVPERIQVGGDDELSLDELDFSLESPETPEESSVRGDKSPGQDDEFAALSLDDIDLFGNLPVAPPVQPSPPPPVDDDLNFNLDLGEFGGPQKAPSRKGVDDIPDINLSLD